MKKNMQLIGMPLMLAALWTTTLTSAFGETRELSRKDIFNDEYPKFFIFRGEYKKDVNSSYENYVISGASGNGYIQKYVPYDEMPNIHPTRTAGYATRYANENPDKLMLLHWNAQDHVNSVLKSSSKYFPGHWATMKGAHLLKDCDIQDNVIYVSDVEKFAEKTKNPKARSIWKYPVLLLVELDVAGKPIWENYEYVAVDKVSEASSAITVRRGVALSTPRSFKKGSRVAQILTYLSSEYLFRFNYSSNCPRDKNGKNAADVQLQELFDLFDNKKGLLRDLDGIAFDVLYWEPQASDRMMLDLDADGICDGGFDPVTGEDLWRKGAYDFQARVRAHFGDEFILMSDLYTPNNQRALGLFNGIESEGLVRHNDAFRGFSKTINVYSFWNAHNPLKYNLPTIVTKVENPKDIPETEKYNRLCIATATCLDAAVNVRPAMDPLSLPDELICGKKNKRFWLGSPITKITYADGSRDITNGRFSSGEKLMKILSSDNCKFYPKGEDLQIVNQNISDYGGECRFYTQKIKIPEQVNDIVLSFSILSEEGLTEISPAIPRFVRVVADGLPAYENNPRLNDMYNDMWGLCDSKKYSPLVFLYRNVAGKELSFEFVIEGTGNLRIKDFEILASSGAFYREYDNGIILVNPSLGSYTFDLAKISPGHTYRRIAGKSSVNDGSKISSSVTLAPVDALFLIKQ